MLDESARWGNLGELDGTWNEMGTPATWDTRLDWELGTFFPGRTATMFTEFETAVNIHAPAGGNAATRTPTRCIRASPHPCCTSTARPERRHDLARRGAHHDDVGAGGRIIYYTTDGSDPRVDGTDFTISSITLSGTTATVTLGSTSTGFRNGEEIYIGGASQTAYDGEFAIANLTANSTAGTTTFTCTVTGSPASPATPLAGQSLIAATGSGGAISSTALKYTGAIALSESEDDQCPRLFRGHLEP